MNIETTLNRKGQFRNEYHKAVVNVNYTGIWVQEQLTQMLSTFNLSYQQYNILRIVGRSEKPLSTLQIRELMMDRMSDTSRIVDRMIIKQLLVKSINKKDKRLVDITLSAKGKKLIQTLETEFDSKVDKLTAALTPKEAKQLNSLLDKMRG
jgi:DNA-binding MarR family transcriptional regulator